MATYDSVQSTIERCLNLLSPDINTYDDPQTLQEHVIEIADVIKDLNDLVRELDDRVLSLENP